MLLRSCRINVLLRRDLFSQQLQSRTMSQFRVVEHVARCQHTRDRPAGAELGRHNELRLHVKQYIPKSNPNPRPGDVTIIGAHANGFPKEMYEPFWDELLQGMCGGEHRIRSIWIADVASQGRSGILNEELVGPEASWWDHARDLLYLINQFQDDMPAPIIGLGHSMGASNLALMSLIHPSLLHGLILIDPIQQRDLRLHRMLAAASTPRRDIWPSRQIAAQKFAATQYYQRWDKRVLDKWVEYGLRDLPTEQYPDPTLFSNGTDIPVTLTATKAQEVYFYVRAAYPEDRLLHFDGDLQSDIRPEDRDGSPFARPESQELFHRMPELRPSVLYVFGSQSPVSVPEARRLKVELTGTGTGGSGGAAKGLVKEALVNAGHLVVMEKPAECAHVCAAHIIDEADRWTQEQQRKRAIVQNLTRSQRVNISDQWQEHLGIVQSQSTAESVRKKSKL